ncbi:MAG TPA: hypothetical protein VNI57_09935 [Candidatus Saccharimonadales bacterium]|nr:hypothetical protein [Candidatus Saccharimonadales bacterium]
MGIPAGAVSQVVVHHLDGRLLKGTTRDFFPNKQVFHVYPEGTDNPEAVEVTLSLVKALFFVKTFEGNKDHRKDNSFEDAKGQGRRILVIFKDGETMAGFTNGYAPDRPGFFIIPADPRSNNLRVFVVNSAVSKVEWVSAPRPQPVGAPGR